MQQQRYPLSCPLQVTSEDLPDLLLSAFRQLRQSSLHLGRLGSGMLLRLNVPEKHMGRII